jgi:hypothetical protein
MSIENQHSKSALSRHDCTPRHIPGNVPAAARRMVRADAMRAKPVASSDRILSKLGLLAINAEVAAP